MVTKAMNTSEIHTLTYKALAYTAGLPFLPFPTFVALSFTIFAFPPHLLFQITHPSPWFFFCLVHLVPPSPQGLCACCSTRNSAPRELGGLLHSFLQVSLINWHLGREVFPQLPVKNNAY